MAIMRYNGGILRTPDGIAYDPSCCCDPPVVCDDCCTKILDGTWVPATMDVAAHWAFRFDSLTTDDYMTVQVFGIGANAMVCDGDEITVHSDYIHGDAVDPDDGHGAEEPNHSPVVTWDRAWELDGVSPSVGAGGTTFSHGMIKWDDEEDVHHIEVGFKYTACWSDKLVQYGDIQVAWHEESMVVSLEFEDCERTATDDCCESTHDCEDCCFYLPDEAGERNPDNDEIVFWGEDSGVKVRVSLSVDPDDRILYCFETGGSVTINIDVIPPPEYNAGFVPEICIHWPGWWPGSLPTDPSCPRPKDEDCDDEDWTHNASGWSTSLTYLAPDCEHDCFDAAPLSLMTVTAGLEGSGASPIEVETAELESCGGDCCCDEYVPCCSVHCFFDIKIPDDPQEDINHNLYTTEGPTTITGYKVTSTFGPDVITYEQAEDAGVYYDEVVVSQPGCPEKKKPYITQQDSSNIFFRNLVKENGTTLTTLGFIARIQICNTTKIIIIDQDEPSGYLEPAVSIPLTGCGGHITHTYTDIHGAHHVIELTLEGGSEIPYDSDDLRCNGHRLEINEGGIWRKLLRSEI